ncbi:hypothetical protein [Sporolactobacillus sp. KGMB 08714]|uniref:hypothetical protein n=1 Tax=Sporolactobacillus sp. KGMB 08714 TaxID=3064704 RepID=UPI002FBE0755
MNEVTRLLVSIHNGNKRMTDQEFSSRFRGQSRRIQKGVHGFEHELEKARKKYWNES